MPNILLLPPNWMKRTGYLLDKIIDLNNLYLAFYKAQKGKSLKPDVIQFRKNLNTNIIQLREQILTGTVEIGNYHYFTIYDPKERVICAAPFKQRVLHHAVMNVCHPLFDRHLIADCFASRIGKGTFAALNKAKLNNSNYRWFLKLDFRKYFNSIDHAILKQQLCKLFKDKQILELFDKIIQSYHFVPQKGVPIGNLTSQYFANHYLSEADHYVKQTLQIPAYVRYMDDMVLWHNNKEKLLEAGSLLQQYTECRLKLTLKPFCLNQNEKGLPFLGFQINCNYVKLSPGSKHRFISKAKEYEYNLRQGLWSQKQYSAHITPLIAFTENANATELRNNFFNKASFN